MAPTPRTRVDLYFTSRFDGAPGGILFVPGRVVLLGEHVDHQGGEVLAVPTQEGVYVAWGIRPDSRIAVHALNARATDRFQQGNIVRSGRRWADLARGVCATLADEGRRLPGLNLAIYGDLPTAVGLASSAAYTSGILGSFLAACGEEPEPPHVAHVVARVEREWGGVACGFMDPYVVTAGRAGEVLRLDNRSLTHEVLALPPDTRLDHESTGITRRLSETPYNERRRELADALARLRATDPGLKRLTDLDPNRFAVLADTLEDPHRRRVRHVVTEVDRVARGVAALRDADADALGALMRECHESLRDDFECSMPEIDAQVAAACAEPKVIGARLQGAGWGGSLAVLRRTD
jgi:galactokinase